MRNRLPVRLLAGALAVLAIFQISMLAVRHTTRPSRPVSARPAAALSVPEPAAIRARLVAFDVALPPRVVPHLKLPGHKPISLQAVPKPARRAIRSALSEVGTPYRWAAASPGSGFDCSGLTMWAYGTAGVALPHNSRAQYAALPHVSRDELRPGDLLFFYSPISHVALYVGNGLMVDAVTSRYQVVLQPVWWDTLVGAARVPHRRA